MSSITVTFSADSTEELYEKIRSFSGGTTQVDSPEIGKAVQKKEKDQPAIKKTDKKLAKKQADSTDSISDTEPSKTGEVQKPTEKVGQEEPEKSVTVGQHPNATKADVQAAMKNAMAKKKRDAILTAFERFNASKLSDLKEEDYSAFITDLEALVGE
jgi:esterase/lipase superfamily enzyme